MTHFAGFRAFTVVEPTLGGASKAVFLSTGSRVHVGEGLSKRNSFRLISFSFESNKGPFQNDGRFVSWFLA